MFLKFPLNICSILLWIINWCLVWAETWTENVALKTCVAQLADHLTLEAGCRSNGLATYQRRCQQNQRKRDWQRRQCYRNWNLKANNWSQYVPFWVTVCSVVAAHGCYNRAHGIHRCRDKTSNWQTLCVANITTQLIPWFNNKTGCAAQTPGPRAHA